MCAYILNFLIIDSYINAIDLSLNATIQVLLW
jgi:hypothetical protein